MAHIMVLDDEPSICWAFRNAFSDDGHRVTVASNAKQALARLTTDPADVLFLDVRLQGADGLSALDRIRDLSPATAVIVMTAYGTIQTAVRAVRGGAFDYLPKPFDLAQVRALVGRALEGRRAARRAAPSRPATTGPGVIIGRSAALQMVFKQVAVAASCSEPVLITGESGTGKELVARAIHQHGDRAAEPFVAVHLAAMPEGLVERELFGHEKGAYTGADTARMGLLDRAGRGTVFFDEVAEAPAPIQAKLLRVLDGGEYRPVGGGPEKHLSARVIAATNRDLAHWVRSGQFRADLYYRLAVLPIHLPPLRQRSEDILLLWDHFLDRVAPGQYPPLDPATPLARCLMAHDWPGNVRELRNAAEHAARSSGGGPIHRDHLPAAIRSDSARMAQASGELEEMIARWAKARLEGAAGGETDLYDQFLAAVEAPLLRAAWVWSGGNQARMARRLGLHRTTLRQKLRQLGLDTSKAD
jgi:DNA-binding NtrC family response regulator